MCRFTLANIFSTPGSELRGPLFAAGLFRAGCQILLKEVELGVKFLAQITSNSTISLTFK